MFYYELCAWTTWGEAGVRIAEKETPVGYLNKIVRTEKKSKKCVLEKKKVKKFFFFK